MDSFELNKVAGAVLGAVLLIFGISILSEQLFHAEAPETPGYVIEVTEAGHGDEQAGEAAEPEESIASLLASADADAGVSVFKKCAACHTANEGGSNKVGPNLWNIVNRPTASIDGFSYSGPMADLGGGGGTWSFDALNTFLTKPKDFLKGTKMAFAGIKKPGDRANLIAYLRSLSASLVELPAVETMMEPAAEGEIEKDANADGHGAAADSDTASAAPASDTANTDTAA
ncbi:MAG: c-type cytochrome, partial [Alphaproteobacteria bacterium]